MRRQDRNLFPVVRGRSHELERKFPRIRPAQLSRRGAQTTFHVCQAIWREVQPQPGFDKPAEARHNFRWNGVVHGSLAHRAVERGMILNR
jgi:hypothetical protein